MANLPNIGVAMYNGFVFPNTTETQELRITPVWNAAGTTIIYSRFSLTLTCVIETRFNDRAMRAAIVQLTQPACGLVYNGRGCGDIRINLGGAKDCVWGPSPGPAVVKPLGAGRASRLTWTVEFAIPTCTDARYDGPMEVSYKQSVSLDKSGYSQRTVSGFVRIAQTRQTAGDRVIRKSADEWRDRINPPLLNGFRRIPGTFDLSEDGCRLDFNIRDEQMGPNIPPPGIVEAEADHTYTSEAGNYQKWTGTISATYELSLGAPATAAVRPFGELVIDRLAELRLFGAGARKELNPFPISATVAETKIYDKPTVQMSLQYRVAGASLDDILVFGGLFRKVPRARAAQVQAQAADGRGFVANAAAILAAKAGSFGGSDWDLWVKHLGNNVHSCGSAQLRFSAGDIVDLCGPIPPPPKPKPPPKTKTVELRGGGIPPPRPKGGPPERSLELTTPPPPTGLVGAEIFKKAFPPPTPGGSWMEYTIAVTFEVDQGTAVGVTLPGVPLSSPNETSPGSTFTGSRYYPHNGEVFVHQRHKPVVYVVLTGGAVRVGYPVPIPALLSWGGRPLVACNRESVEFFQQRIVANVLYPVYGARWRLRWVCPNPPPGELPVAPNPFMT